MVQENNIKPNIIVITGPTASGKSSAAVDVAKRVGGEIISVDSVQIYIGLNIGSAKITTEEKQGIPHHNIDIFQPTEEYNVMLFCSFAKKCITEIINRGKVPVLVGGTTMYFKALLEGYTFYGTDRSCSRPSSVAVDLEEAKRLYAELAELSPELSQKVHPNNIKRVIRYLEIAKNSSSIEERVPLSTDYDIILVNLVVDRDVLYQRIDARVDSMMKSGLVQEVVDIRAIYPSVDLPALSTIGYKEICHYLDGHIDYYTAVDKIKQHSRNYAKRQITFIKTINGIQNIPFVGDTTDIIKYIQEHINDKT